jgi:hypothetical protein
MDIAERLRRRRDIGPMSQAVRFVVVTIRDFSKDAPVTR